MVRQSTGKACQVWAVLSYRAGENSQILGLSEALGVEFEHKQMSYKASGALGNLARRVGLFGIDVSASSPLEPPWPRLIISAGLRNEPICRAVAERSRGHTKLVFLGRTWASRSEFDLIITTPQYRLPKTHNILHNLGTLHRVTAERLEAQADAWKERLNPSAKPSIAILIGGRSGPYTFGKFAAERLARLANRRAEELGASLLVTSSSRTEPKAIRVLKDLLRVPNKIHQFGLGENPYFGMLALADEIIVTGDSVAMLSEAVATGKPVWLFDLGAGGRSMKPTGTEGRRDRTPRTELYQALMRLGPNRLSRELRLAHDAFVKVGLANWLEDGACPAPGGQSGDLERAVGRIHNEFL